MLPAHAITAAPWLTRSCSARRHGGRGAPQAMRLFVGEPVWTPYNRPQDKHASRLKYLAAFGKKQVEA